MGIERRAIKLIKSLDRIMDTWNNLTLRRTIVIIYTILILIQVTLVIFLLIFGREISTNWLGIFGIEFGAWGTILAYYFNIRGKIDEQNIKNGISEREEIEGEEQEDNDNKG